MRMGASTIRDQRRKWFRSQQPGPQPKTAMTISALRGTATKPTTSCSQWDWNS